MTNRRFTDSEELEIEKIYRAGEFSLYSISRQYHCHPNTIRSAVRRAGGKIRTSEDATALRWARAIPWSHTLFREAEAREIEKIYRVGLISSEAIAAQYHCSSHAVRDAIRHVGGHLYTPEELADIKRDKSKRGIGTRFSWAEMVEIEKIYRVGPASATRLAKQYGCTSGTIQRAIVRVGGTVRSRQEARMLPWKKGKRTPRYLFSRAEAEQIEKIYRVGKFSSIQIAKQYHCSSTAILKTIKRVGGNARTAKEAGALRWPNLFISDRQGYLCVSISRLRGNAQRLARLTVRKSERIGLHRLIMALHLRRPLTSREVVHHKDGDKTNYRLNNLELLSRETHTSGFGEPYYLKLQEALTEIAKLKSRIEYLEAH